MNNLNEELEHVRKLKTSICFGACEIQNCKVTSSSLMKDKIF